MVLGCFSFSAMDFWIRDLACVVRVWCDAIWICDELDFFVTLVYDLLFNVSSLCVVFVGEIWRS